MGKYKHVVTGVLLPIFLAAIGYLDLSQRPTYASFRPVDIVQLIGCGMCLGIALTGFIEFLQTQRSN